VKKNFQDFLQKKDFVSILQKKICARPGRILNTNVRLDQAYTMF